jgi:hypothetical protein
MRRLFLGTVAALAFAGAANAGTIVWGLNIPTSPPALGVTQPYTVGSQTIVASGFTGGEGSTSFWTPTDLSGKNNPPNETGLGIYSDPTNKDGEIWGTTFIQIDVSQVHGATGFDFHMESVTGAEAWTVYGMNTTGTGPLSNPLPGLQNGTDQLEHNLPTGYQYFDFAYTGPTDIGAGVSNVLLGDFSATIAVPEPATWVMMLLGFAGLGFAGYRKADRMSSAAA